MMMVVVVVVVESGREISALASLLLAAGGSRSGRQRTVRRRARPRGESRGGHRPVEVVSETAQAVDVVGVVEGLRRSRHCGGFFLGEVFWFELAVLEMGGGWY